MGTRDAQYAVSGIRSADRINGGMSELRRMQAAEQEQERQRQEQSSIEAAVKKGREQAEALTNPAKLAALIGEYEIDIDDSQTQEDALAEIETFKQANLGYVMTPENGKLFIHLMKEVLNPPAKITAKVLGKLYQILMGMNRLEKQSVKTEPVRTERVRWASEREPKRDERGRFVSESPKPPKIEEMSEPSADLMIGYDLAELKQGRKKLKKISPMEEALLSGDDYLRVYGIGKYRSTVAPMSLTRSGDR